MHCQHSFAAEDVLGMLGQQVPHEHVEPVLIKNTLRASAEHQ
jgi:hypothetical protein